MALKYFGMARSGVTVNVKSNVKAGGIMLSD